MILAPQDLDAWFRPSSEERQGQPGASRRRRKTPTRSSTRTRRAQGVTAGSRSGTGSARGKLTPLRRAPERVARAGTTRAAQSGADAGRTRVHGWNNAPIGSGYGAVDVMGSVNLRCTHASRRETVAGANVRPSAPVVDAGFACPATLPASPSSSSGRCYQQHAVESAREGLRPSQRGSNALPTHCERMRPRRVSSSGGMVSWTRGPSRASKTRRSAARCAWPRGSW